MTSSPRLRRLAADYEMVRAEFSGSPYVRVNPIGPNRPPERYRITYHLRGLELRGDQPVTSDRHEVEIRLPLGYPREKPMCVPLTPIFHPNVKDYYCIQDYWAAGQPLTDTIAKVGDMIQYRIYNPKSPLDALAARWTVQNASHLPIGNVALAMPAVDVLIGGERPVAPQTASVQVHQPTLPDVVTLPLLARADDDDAELEITLGPSGGRR